MSKENYQSEFLDRNNLVVTDHFQKKYKRSGNEIEIYTIITAQKLKS